MFEPIHGSAPKHAGKNVASPLGAILAVSMMLDYLGERSGSERIENAVASLLRAAAIPSIDTSSGVSTSETGTMVINQIRRSIE
jgi:isocitrate/isopropylmalate dehydrogenase